MQKYAGTALSVEKKFVSNILSISVQSSDEEIAMGDTYSLSSVNVQGLSSKDVELIIPVEAQTLPNS